MTRSSAAGHLAVVALIAIAIIVSAVRPIAHASNRVFPRFPGFTRMSLLSEAPDTDKSSLPPPVEAGAHLIAPALVVGLLPLVLKARRAPLSPVPLRRLKLPALPADRSPASH